MQKNLTGKAALQILYWQKKNLPIDESLLAMEIFLLISHHSIIGKPLTLKILFLSINSSESGIRKNLSKLISNGWVKFDIVEKDRRVKYLIAQRKMVKLLIDYLNLLKNVNELGPS